MTTIEYPLHYPILADSRLEAIMVAGSKLRTGVRVIELVECEQSLPGWWDVRFTVAEDIGADDPPEPEWDLNDHPADATVESEYARP